MIRRPPASTRPDPPFPSTTLFRPPPGALRLQFPEGAVERVARAARRQQRLQVVAGRPRLDRAAYALRLGEHMVDIVAEIIDPVALAAPDMLAVRQGRSEEHTSELQSLMRISYAVFCLKKKKKIQNT